MDDRVPCPNHTNDPVYAFYMQAILVVAWLLFYHLKWQPS